MQVNNLILTASIYIFRFAGSYLQAFFRIWKTVPGQDVSVVVLASYSFLKYLLVVVVSNRINLTYSDKSYVP